MTRESYYEHLFYHLQLRKFNVLAIGHPIVPRGTERVRLVFHVNHTDAQVEALADAICEWAQEMLSLEDSEQRLTGLPRAAQQAIAYAEGEPDDQQQQPPRRKWSAPTARL
jgi:8-amino-7-oxononanoate synthase